MGYKFYNDNPLGKYENDCVVRGISMATGKSWDEVYENLSDIAQFNGTMMDDKKFVDKYLNSKYDVVPYLPYTVGEVAEEYHDNILIITAKGHVTCSKYGIVYDSFDPRDYMAENAFIVK